MVGGCVIPRRDSHLPQLYAFLQKLILILAEPLGFGRTQFKNHWIRLLLTMVWKLWQVVTSEAGRYTSVKIVRLSSSRFGFDSESITYKINIHSFPA